MYLCFSGIRACHGLEMHRDLEGLPPGSVAINPPSPQWQDRQLLER